MRKNYLKFIIPVVAVLVVIESIVLVGNLKTKEIPTNLPVVEDKGAGLPTRALEPLAVRVVSERKTAEVGKVARARVELLPRVVKAMDGVSVYVKFDPAMVRVSNLEFNADLPKPIVGKISKSGDLVVVNYLIAAKDGYQLIANRPVDLVSFDFWPLKAGTVAFDLLTAKESKDSATMVVENGTSLSLSLAVSNLKIEAQGKR